MPIPKKVTENLRNAVALHSSNVGSGRTFEVSRIDSGFVKNLRLKLGMSQAKFSIKFGFSVRTLQKWESGDRSPEGPARAYLMVISEIPTQVSRALMVSEQKGAQELDLSETVCKHQGV